MKNVVIAFIILFSSSYCNGQQNDLNKFLTSNVWKLDIESMKPHILLKLFFVPEMKELSESDRETAINSVLTSLAKMKYIFGIEGSFKQYISENVEYVGTYSINSKENELITNLEIEPNSVFKIVSFDKNKIVLHHKIRNNDLILIPEH